MRYIISRFTYLLTLGRFGTQGTFTTEGSDLVHKLEWIGMALPNYFGFLFVISVVTNGVQYVYSSL